MGAQEYGALCKRHAEELGISQSRLASRLMRAFALEEDEERTYDATTVRLVYDGRRKIDDKLFEKLNRILEIPKDEAEHTLGIWPAELSLDGYRRYRRHLAAVGASSVQGNPRSGPSGHHPGQRRRVERRRRDRRGLRLVPPLKPAA